MHKAYIYIDSTDESGQTTVAAGVTEVIAAYGVRVLVHATDEELAALESAGLRVELADEMDSLPFPGASTETEAPLAMKSGAELEGQTIAKSKTKAKTKTKPAKKKSTKTSAAAFAELSEDPVHWLVQFVGPPLPEWVDGVRATGAEIVGPIPPNIVLVRMTTAQADAVKAVDRVQWVGPYQASFKVSPDIPAPSTPPETVAPSKKAPRKAAARAAETPAPPERVALTIVLFDANALASVMAEIESHGGVVQKAAMNTIICDLSPSAIPDIAALSVVAKISPYTLPGPTMQIARGITRVQSVFDTHGLDGEDEIVCVADTGLDQGAAGMHPDFSVLGVPGRFRVLRGYTPEQVDPSVPVALRRGAWSDLTGHGTHVAGIAVGNGSASGPNRPNSGVAFKAQLVMQALPDASGSYGGLPPNYNALFEPVYANDGARVHNDSWGSFTGLAQYSSSAHPYETDEFVWRNPDMVIIFTSANLGTDGQRAAATANNPQAVDPLANPAAPAPADGIVDFASLSPEGTGRNIITVGATENTRVGIWSTPPNAANDLRWGAGPWSPGSGQFPGGGVLTIDPVANSAEDLAAFSGRGPTIVPTPPGPPAFRADRIKPDVVAPGSSILSSLSTLVPLPLSAANQGWGINPPPRYMYSGGTSMAAPHVAGMCALIRQYLRKVHHLSDPNNPIRRRRRPSAALIKALLVHGARAVTGQNAANAGTVPGNHQGWGLVDLRRTLFSLLKSSLASQDPSWLPRRTIFIDNPDITLNGPAPASRPSHSVKVTVADSSVPLRATLVWTDFPGPVAPNPGTLVNQLQLQIVRGLNTTPFILPPGLQPIPPAVSAPVTALSNNVQQIDIAAPALGDYEVQVIANTIGSFATANEPQDFALVISGAISHSDHTAPLAPVPRRMAALPDLAFVDLHPDPTGRELHDGLAPSPEPPRGNLGSPDIWVSRAQSADPARAVSHLEIGQTHYVYVRVRNLGFAPANGAQINLYWADPTTPLAYPADWRTEGFRVDGVDGNQRTANVPARTKVAAAWQDGEFIVGPFEWTLPRGVERVALLVRAVHPDDPIVNEGDVRWDNNIARRDMLIQDNTTQVQGNPTIHERFVFLNTFGAVPRRIELRMELAYQDVRDGQVKPLPAGVEVEVWDYDPGPRDQKLAQGRTAVSINDSGGRTSVLHLSFSILAAAEVAPDIYIKVLKPAGAEFSEFVDNSFFAAAATVWSSFDRATALAVPGGFFQQDLTGNSIGIRAPVALVIRPAGIQVRVAFEYLSGLSNQFENLPRGIEVRVKDSSPTARQPLLATATINDNGEIVTVLPRPADSRPSIYFEIEKTVANQGNFLLVDYFAAQNIWDSRTNPGEIVALDNTVSSISGHFQNWAQDRLVAANQRLRFRLGSPNILMHLRFQYWDREAIPPAYVDLPPGTEVEAREIGAAAAVSSLVTGTVGANGRVELTVPKGHRPQLNLFARVIMRRRLTANADEISVPTVEVRKAGQVVRWDTNAAGRTATDGTLGAFNAVVDHVATAAAPLVFQIGAAGDSGNAADNTDVNAAPFILKVIGDVHDWLRTRLGSEWPGIFQLRVNLVNGLPAEGSRFTGNDNTIHLNTARTAAAGPAFDHRNRNIIAHHYGHLALEWLLLSSLHPQRTVPSMPNHHTYIPGAEQPGQLRRVLSEGWAEYVASRHRLATPPVAPDPATPPRAWRGDLNGANNSGEIVPIAVANALWQLDRQVCGQGDPIRGNNINDPVNQHRFRALIVNAIKSLAAGNVNQQVAFGLYRAIQSANLAAADLIPPHDITFIRQMVRQIFEANGMVFTRGRIKAAAVLPPAAPLRYRFQVKPADHAKLNVAAMGRIIAYRIQAAPAGTPNFVNLEPVVPVTHTNQNENVDLNLTAAGQSGALITTGAHDFRVIAQDEFGAWDTFADDLSGNTPGTTGVTNNDTWQRNRLKSILAATINVP